MNMTTNEHRIGELVRLVWLATAQEDTFLRFRSLKTGYYLNRHTGVFEPGEATPINMALDPHTFYMEDLYDTGLVHVQLTTMVPTAGEFLAEFWVDDEIDGREIHRFGGVESIYEPSRCQVYGTIRDVTGAPVAGQRVDVVLSNGGYFPHKSGFISTAAHTLSDSSGYFSIDLVHGIDVVISIPSIGFTQKGIVPPVASVEIKDLLRRV